MSTLIYAPEATVLIRTAPTSRGKGKIIDVSADVSRGSISRITGGVSTANLTILNQGRKYDGMFTPMDTVVIYLKRLRKVLKLSGYVSAVPLWSALPGSVSLRCACSLKRLQDWMWDPGTDASVALLSKLWVGSNQYQMGDGGLAQRAVDLMGKVANWPANKIHIAQVPTQWFNTVHNLGNQLVQEANAISSAQTAGQGAWLSGSNPLVGQATSSIQGIGLGTGVLPDTTGRCSEFGGPHGGAYGNMGLTGESGVHPKDDWYCAIRAPYVVPGAVPGAKQWWTNRRLVVYNTRTHKSVVVRVADWGPAQVTGRVIDLAPGAMNAMSGRTDDIVHIGFAPKGAQLGSISAISAAAQAVGTVLGNAGVSATPTKKWTPPIHGKFTVTARFGDKGSHWSLGFHTGDDFAAPTGTNIYPVGPGVVHSVNADGAAYGNHVVIDHGNNWYTLYAHFLKPPSVSVGQAVTQNTVIGQLDTTGNAYGPHCHVELRHPADAFSVADFPAGGIYPYVMGGPNRPDPPSGTAPASGIDLTNTAAGSGNVTGGGLIAAYDFMRYGQNSEESNALSGPRALMNDEPFLSTLGEFMSAGLRDFCSAPNGDFISWFPDYFGHFGQAGKMVISDLEINMDSGPPTIDWDETGLKTHQFVIAATSAEAGDAATIPVESGTAGIASVEQPELMQALLNISREEAVAMSTDLLRRYGARPVTTPMNNIVGHTKEFLFACFLFQKNWTQQYQASINLTFMPELYPGMLLVIPSLGIQGYIRSTTDTWSMDEGFSTTVDCAPWSTIGNAKSVVGGVNLPKGAPL